MIFGVILAGGIGNRMGSTKPKQFLNIGGKPIIVHTIEKFMSVREFENILVLCPREWKEYTEGLINEFIPDADRLVVSEGGKDRSDTLMNAISYIEKNGKLTEDTFIVSHDAVRPFVTQRILKENIEAVKRYGACTTAISATDTIAESLNGEIVSRVLERRVLYQVQTPQSFNAMKLKKMYKKLTYDEKRTLTDAAKIFSLKGEPVYLVPGELFNIKITYQYDLMIAESIIEGGL